MFFTIVTTFNLIIPFNCFPFVKDFRNYFLIFHQRL